MEHPEVFYALALGCVVAVEIGFRVFRRDAFGPMTWVLAAVFVLSYAALLAGIDLPSAQLVLHSAGLVAGFVVARGMVGHFCAALFLPMGILGSFELLGFISPATWWWGLFYLACAQLVFLGVGSNLHPLGRELRRWSDRVHQHFNRLVGVS